MLERERESVCVEAARMPHYWDWLVDTSLDSDHWLRQCGQENTKHNNSQGLLGPAASCPLKTCLAGRTEGGGGGRVSSQDIGGREEKPLNLLSTIWTLYGHNRLLHCESNTVLYISQYHRAIQSCIFLCKYL